MKKKFITYSIASAIVALAAISCTDESDLLPNNDVNGIFRLASDQQAFTRASEKVFDENTAYQLYAIVGNDFSKNFLKTSPEDGGAVTGREAEDHNSITGIEANKFDGKTLNFYGVTNSTPTPVVIRTNGSNAPTCNIQYEGDTPLTDVMWAKKENQTHQNAGTIKLMFGHTLSKLNLYVMKNSDYKNKTITLQEVSLLDYPKGSLNMQTGKYELQSSDKREHKAVVFSGSSQEVTETAEIIKKGNTAVTPMIFPTRKEDLKPGDRTNHSLRVKVKVKVGYKQPIEQETEITSILAESVGNPPEVPFEFKGNHEYDMVITVTGSSLVVTIVPRVYEWIPEEEVKIDSDVNGSMTIGGITWMDRNLGATSGDPLAGDQAWEDSRGYYYQFGRNIPYFIKTKTDGHGIIYAPANGNWHLEESMPYPFIPGKMDKKPTASTSNPAEYPTDVTKNFNFIYGENWGNNSGTNWNNSNNQPCPKGWRIPTANEFKLIIPNSAEAGDITFSYKNTTWPGPVDHTTVDIFSKTETNDPETGSTSQYIGVKKNKWNETTEGIVHSIYALKRKDTDNAYYLRWHIERSGEHKLVNACNTTDRGDDYRNVLVISRYPATKSSALTQENVKTAAKWDNPVEQIKLPISGYIHYGPQDDENKNTMRPALIYSGTEAVYWTSSPIGAKSYTVRMKFKGDASDSQIKMFNDEKRTNGCLIRCVRDTKAN